jgi:hypothetical protein
MKLLGFLTAVTLLSRRGMDLIIVRGTLSTAYYFFLQTFADARGMKVLLDRRSSERRKHVRQGSGGGETDRRRPNPATWERGDFVVVPSARAAQLRIESASLSAAAPVNVQRSEAMAASMGAANPGVQARAGVVIPFKRRLTTKPY